MTTVIDSSVALEWLLEQERGPQAETILRTEDDLVVSPLFWIEVAHVLTKWMRRGILTQEQREVSLIDLGRLGLSTATDRIDAVSAVRTTALCDRYGLTGYDATHLDLAIWIGGRFATFDGPLTKAARSAGLSVFPGT